MDMDKEYFILHMIDEGDINIIYCFVYNLIMAFLYISWVTITKYDYRNIPNYLNQTTI